MLIKLPIWTVALTCILSANSLLAEGNGELIIQTTEDMDIKKVEAWLDNDTIQRDSGLKKHYANKLSILKNNH